jgi:hypothetical protein
MPCVDVVRSSAVVRSPRVMQLEGLFDLPPAERSEVVWRAELPLDERPWSVGLIVGPSGAGKSTIARELFGDAVVQGFDWPADRSLVDGFPTRMGVKEISTLLSSVGLASVPTWLRPFHCLSTGEQFRATVARALAEAETNLTAPIPSPLVGEGGELASRVRGTLKLSDRVSAFDPPHPRPLSHKGRGEKEGARAMPLVVIDEFTSVVDRTVAKIGSAAIAKAVRARKIKFVAVTCHFDVAEWLCPDWTYEPATSDFQWRCLQRRPPIELAVRRASRNDWRLFHRHHYLNADLASAARCFVGSVEGSPAVFTAVLPFPHALRPGWREHRTVCLPDFQGVGIGNAFSAFVASLFKATGKPYRSVTGNPAMIHHRAKSPLWKMTRPPSQVGVSSMRGFARSSARSRMTASFEYVGPARGEEASRLGVKRG